MKKILFLALALLLGTATFAQRYYDAQRRTHFENLPVTSKDIIFLGNSLTNGCEWAELFDNRHIKNRGINGDRASWMIERLDPIIAGHPKKVFLMIGTNDLSDGVSPREVVDYIRKIVDRFQTESSWTRIFVQSLLPVNGSLCDIYSNHYARGAEIVAVNKMLRALCEEKDVAYLDVYSVMVDAHGNLNPAYTNDGLHLMSDGYMAWKKVLEPYVK